MEEQTQTQTTPTKPAPTPPAPARQTSKTLTIIVALVFLIMASGLVYLGYQNYQLRLKTDQLLQENFTPKQKLTSPSPTPTTYDKDVPGDVDCSGATQDNICPQWCAAGSDYDCCIRSNKEWVPERGCY